MSLPTSSFTHYIGFDWSGAQLRYESRRRDAKFSLKEEIDMEGFIPSRFAPKYTERKPFHYKMENLSNKSKIHYFNPLEKIPAFTSDPNKSQSKTLSKTPATISRKLDKCLPPKKLSQKKEIGLYCEHCTSLFLPHIRLDKVNDKLLSNLSSGEKRRLPIVKVNANVQLPHDQIRTPLSVCCNCGRELLSELDSKLISHSDQNVQIESQPANDPILSLTEHISTSHVATKVLNKITHTDREPSQKQICSDFDFLSVPAICPILHPDSGGYYISRTKKSIRLHVYLPKPLNDSDIE